MTARLTAQKSVAPEEVTCSLNITSDGGHLIAPGQGSGNIVVFQISSYGSLTRKIMLKAGIKPWWGKMVNSPGKP